VARSFQHPAVNVLSMSITLLHFIGYFSGEIELGSPPLGLLRPFFLEDNFFMGQMPLLPITEPTWSRHCKKLSYRTRTAQHTFNHCTAKKTNEWVLNKAGVKRELLGTVKATKLAYYGHTMRKQGKKR